LKHPPVRLDQIALNINLEQAGAKNRGVKGIWAIGNRFLEPALVAAQKKAGGVELRFDDLESQLPAVQESDTLSFYLNGTPAVLLGCGGFPERHTPQDTPELIDYDHLYTLSLLLYFYIAELGNQIGPRFRGR
jgi:hypothetical protein